MTGMRTYTILEHAWGARSGVPYDYEPGVVKSSDQAEIRVLERLVKHGHAVRGAANTKEKQHG